MVAGFDNAEDFAPVVGWELYQVTVDKYHVMFLFDNGWQLLNVAHSFSYRSADGIVSYTYEIYGAGKGLNVDGILRQRVTEVEVRNKRELALIFQNGDELSVHDHPDYRSWWFMPVSDPASPAEAQGWSMSDDD